MIYLFSQIAISLVLAGIVGGAIAWLVYRARAGRQIDELHALLSRQQQQVSEAQTQVSMLTNDYDELKQRSQNAIEELSYENQQIPVLNQNLEKSQLLVNQLIAKHKSDSSALINENKDLLEKAKLADDRELALTKLRAELDSEKRRNRKLSGEEEPEETQESDVNDGLSIDSNSDTSDLLATQSDTATADISTEFDSKLEASTTPESNHIDSDVEKFTTPATAQSAVDSTPTKPEVTFESLQSAHQSAPLSAHRSPINIDANSHSTSHSTSESSQPKRQVRAHAPKVELPNQNIEPLFESVEQHDDLKQIFGIGPLTEKTLNKLGITSYSQLADLKRHDIEKIAEALHIVPDRIERDNWVGSARSQLEEVLENL